MTKIRYYFDSTLEMFFRAQISGQSVLPYFPEGEKSSELFLEHTLRITTKLTSHHLFLDGVAINWLKLIPGTDRPQNIFSKSHMTHNAVVMGKQY